MTDPSGAAIPNAKVEALNVGTGVVKSTQTDERGSYLFNDLQVGTYKVSFSAPSFDTRVVEGVQVAQNTTLRARIHAVRFRRCRRRSWSARARSRCRRTARISTT